MLFLRITGLHKKQVIKIHLTGFLLIFNKKLLTHPKNKRHNWNKKNILEHFKEHLKIIFKYKDLN